MLNNLRTIIAPILLLVAAGYPLLYSANTIVESQSGIYQLKKTKTDQATTISVFNQDNIQCGHIVYLSNTAWISNLKVNPEFQKKGIGKLLFFEALTELKSQGFTKARWIADEQVVPFYEKLNAYKSNEPLLQEQDDSGQIICSYFMEINL